MARLDDLLRIDGVMAAVSSRRMARWSTTGPTQIAPEVAAVRAVLRTVSMMFSSLAAHSRI